MSILIKELHLPSERLYPLHLTIYSDGSVFCGHGIGKRSYEAIEVPVPHGRLIDADALMRHRVMLPRGGGSMPVIYASYLRNAPTIVPAEEKEENFCADCHWYESEQQYCFRNGCHAFNESTCELWEPMPADEPIPAEEET